MQTPDETLRRAIGSLPRQRVAAREPAAQVRPRRALRLGLPRAARRRPEGPRRPERHRGRTSPTCTPGPRSTSPAPAGSAWTRRAPCSPARVTSRSARRRTPRAPPRSRARTEPVEVTFEFRNEVIRIHEDPRTTKPYTDEQWARIDALGGAVDERLLDGDVRLTMGGEPTFVALDDATSAEWNTDADGEHKRELAGILAERLRATYALGGVVHRGQGKWYPGEDAAALEHRAAVAHRRRAALERPVAARRPVGEGCRSRRALQRRGARPCGDRGARHPGSSPAAGVRGPVRRDRRRDPQAGRASPRRRRRGRGRCRRARSHRQRPRPAGCCRSRPRESGRARRGASAAGDSCSPPARAPSACDCRWTRSRGRTPSTPASRRTSRRGRRCTPGIPKVTVVDPKDARTTALTFEARDGHVHVFLPPTMTLEAYCDLLHVIEEAAATHALPARARGLRSAAGRAPDPAHRHARPGRDRGQRAADLVVGGPAPPHRDAVRRGAPEPPRDREVRPRRPAHRHRRRQPHHPRRLAAGRFAAAAPPRSAREPDHVLAAASEPVVPVLGPVHRPDEPGAALRRGPPRGGLRDGDRAAGDPRGSPRRRANSARSPRRGSSTGRCGTCSPTSPATRTAPSSASTSSTAPTPAAAASGCSSCAASRCRRIRSSRSCRRCSCAASSRCSGRSRTPHRSSGGAPGCTRTSCCPRARPPTSARSSPTCASTASRSRPSWLDAFTEFRFPRIGMTRLAGGIELELRQAIEPWNVLGEEVTEGGTARYVDSSVERIQVKATGLDPRDAPRDVSGVPVPLTSTGRAGEYYAGVRYRAWQPWSALHPSIPVHAPLVFDVVDIASGVSVGRCDVPRRPPGRPVVRPPADQLERGRGPAREPVRAARAHRRARSTSRRCASRRGGRSAPTTRTRSTCDGFRSNEGCSMSLLRDYAAAISQPTLPLSPGPGGRFDEVVGPDGALRPAWKGMAAIAVDLTAAELGRIDSEITTPARRRRRDVRQSRVRVAAVAARPDAARPGCRDLGAARGRPGAAHRASQRPAGRHLRRAATARRRRHPRRGRLRPLRVHAADRALAGLRPAPAHPLEHRSRAGMPPASGACSPIACRRRPASATRWRTDASCRA